MPALTLHIDTFKKVFDTIVSKDVFIKTINGCIYSSVTTDFFEERRRHKRN